jgi:hypothetical protein
MADDVTAFDLRRTPGLKLFVFGDDRLHRALGDMRIGRPARPQTASPT